LLVFDWIRRAARITAASTVIIAVSVTTAAVGTATSVHPAPATSHAETAATAMAFRFWVRSIGFFVGLAFKARTMTDSQLSGDLAVEESFFSGERRGTRSLASRAFVPVFGLVAATAGGKKYHQHGKENQAVTEEFAHRIWGGI
jgi:hypothetical protein